MATIDQSGLQGKIRDRPISQELEAVLLKAAEAAGVDAIYVTSGGQPGSGGGSVGSTRHNGGRAADLQLIAGGKTQVFSDQDGGEIVERFVTAAAANGATGIGAGVRYMGPATLHVGFGRSVDDHSRLVWGANGASANAPQWLRDAASFGWNNPPAWAFSKRDATAGAMSSDDRLVHPQIDIPKRFTLDVIRAAQSTQRTLGIPASVTLAQWAVESAYGTRMPPHSNNPFGIKAKAGEPNVVAWTKEQQHGSLVSVQQAFRVFPSLDEAFIRHAQLLATAPAYAPARRFLTDPDRFADALTGVYATDSSYGAVLKSVMRSNDLYRFDKIDDEAPSSHESDMGTDVVMPLHQGDVDMVLVKALQQQLADLGYSLGKIDGKFGTLTAGALLAFQNENGLPRTGVLDQATQAALRTAQPRRLDDARIKATEKDLAADGSKIVVDAGRSRILSWITGALGALGIGNSAIMNAAGTTTARPAGALPDALLPFLADVEKLRAAPAPAAADLTRLSGVARSLLDQLGSPSLSPDLVQLIDQLRRAIPPDILSKNPDIGRVFDTIGKAAPAKPQVMTTIFDILPTFFASDTALQTTMKGVASVAASVLPGFGGSLAVLGVGLLGRYLANRIAAARVEDHQAGWNIKPLGK